MHFKEHPSNYPLMSYYIIFVLSLALKEKILSLIIVDGLPFA